MELTKTEYIDIFCREKKKYIWKMMSKFVTFFFGGGGLFLHFLQP